MIKRSKISKDHLDDYSFYLNIVSDFAHLYAVRIVVLTTNTPFQRCRFYLPHKSHHICSEYYGNRTILRRSALIDSVYSTAKQQSSTVADSCHLHGICETYWLHNCLVV